MISHQELQLRYHGLLIRLRRARTEGRVLSDLIYSSVAGEQMAVVAAGGVYYVNPVFNGGTYRIRVIEKLVAGEKVVQVDCESRSAVSNGETIVIGGKIEGSRVMAANDLLRVQLQGVLDSVGIQFGPVPQTGTYTFQTIKHQEVIYVSLKPTP